MSPLVLKAVIATACAGAAILAARSPAIDRLSWRDFDRLSLIALLASRLGLFVVVFLLAGMEPTSDVETVYYPQALAALHGAIPYRDFVTSYAPLFPYLAALPVAIWRSAKALVLFAILAEVLNCLIWRTIARTVLDAHRARLAVVLYVCSPIALLNVALDGQNQVLVSLLIGGSILALARKRYVLAGALFGFAFGAVKFLAALAAPPIWAAAGSRRRWSAAALIAIAAIYGAAAAAGADILMPARINVGLETSGNLPYLLAWATGVRLAPEMVQAVLAAAYIGLAAAMLALHKKSPGAFDVSGWIAAFLLVFMTLSPKSFTNYIEMFLCPLMIAVVPLLSRARSILLFAGFEVAAALEPSLWFRWMAQGDLSSAVHSAAGILATGRVVTFVLTDLVLVISYTTMFLFLFRGFLRYSKADR